MKNLFSKVGILATILFILGVFTSGYFLYMLPTHLMSQSADFTFENTAVLKPVFSQIYWVVGASFTIGLLAITFQLLQTNKKEEDKTSQKAKESKSDNAAQDETASYDDHYKTLFAKLDTLEMQPLINELCKNIEASQAAFYEKIEEDGKNFLSLHSSYAFQLPESQQLRYEFGEGLAGQVAKEQKMINIDSVPQGYITILSGLGKASPSHLIILPVQHEDQLVGVVEIASFKPFEKHDEKALQYIFEKIASRIATQTA